MIADLGYFDEQDSLALLYRNILRALLAAHEPGVYIDKGTTAEIIGAHFVLRNPLLNIIASRARKFNYRYMLAEMLWNISGIPDIAPLAAVFPGVLQFVQDQDVTHRHFATWAYGPEMKSGITQCIIELRHNPSSRRAIITLRHPRVVGREELKGTPPCLDSIQWFIREGRLIQVTRMRSNDVWRGFPLDVYQFSMWQLMMAAALGAELGPYHHFANSFHLYERDEPAARALLGADDMEPIASSMPGPSAHLHVAASELSLGLRDWSHSLALMGTDFGWTPWYQSYKGTLTLQEFQLLREHGFGTGW